MTRWQIHCSPPPERWNLIVNPRLSDAVVGVQARPKQAATSWQELQRQLAAAVKQADADGDWNSHARADGLEPAHVQVGGHACEACSKFVIAA